MLYVHRSEVVEKVLRTKGGYFGRVAGSKGEGKGWGRVGVEGDEGGGVRGGLRKQFFRGEKIKTLLGSDARR